MSENNVFASECEIYAFSLLYNVFVKVKFFDKKYKEQSFGKINSYSRLILIFSGESIDHGHYDIYHFIKNDKYHNFKRSLENNENLNFKIKKFKKHYSDYNINNQTYNNINITDSKFSYSKFNENNNLFECFSDFLYGSIIYKKQIKTNITNYILTNWKNFQTFISKDKNLNNPSV